MAALLLDSIINETIHKSFGTSRTDLEDTFLRQNPSSKHEAASKAEEEVFFGGRASNKTLLVLQEQLDSLTQSMQSVEMNQYEKLFWILLFSFMVLIAVGGNTIVVYIVSTNKEMKSVTNYFLVNLSLADTMVSTLNVIFNFISMLNSHWPFGKVYCKISNFIAILSISASVFTLTAISCDRYNAIIHPLRPRMSHSHAIGWILLIWTLSSALAMPNAIYSTLLEDRLANDNVAVTCTMIWPDGRYPTSSYDHIYNIIILVVTYLVPIVTMAILYYKVGKELWGSEAIGENIEKQQRAMMAKKKIVKMMIVVVIIFALCWLPYHAFFVVNYYVPTIFQDVGLLYQRCYLLMYWLAMSNSMYNPIIIYFMNSKFRHEFKKILYFICCCRIYAPQSARSTANTDSNKTMVVNNANVGSKARNKTQNTLISVSIESGQNGPETSMPICDGDESKVIVSNSKSTDQDKNGAIGGGQYTSNYDKLSVVGGINRDELGEDYQAMEREPFLTHNNAQGKQTTNNSNDLTNKTGDKLIDFSNINNKHVTADNPNSEKVWI